MVIKIISFDLQGTLSDVKFSDTFWFKTLPKLYAKKNKISLLNAKNVLKKRFIEYGKYDYRYYSVDYWMKELNLNMAFSQIKKLIGISPVFYKEGKDLISKLSKKYDLIIISSTTSDFINCELGKNKVYFKHIYSSIDDFGISGKPKKLYLKIAKELKVKPAEILHIGDSKEMDIINSKAAGYTTFFFDKNKPQKETYHKLEQFLKEKQVIFA